MCLSWECAEPNSRCLVTREPLELGPVLPHETTKTNTLLLSFSLQFLPPCLTTSPPQKKKKQKKTNIYLLSLLCRYKMNIDPFNGQLTALARYIGWASSTPFFVWSLCCWWFLWYRISGRRIASDYSCPASPLSLSALYPKSYKVGRLCIKLSADYWVPLATCLVASRKERLPRSDNTSRTGFIPSDPYYCGL